MTPRSDAEILAVGGGPVLMVQLARIGVAVVIVTIAVEPGVLAGTTRVTPARMTTGLTIDRLRTVRERCDDLEPLRCDRAAGRRGKEVLACH